MKRILMIAITLFTVISFAQTQPQKPSELVGQKKVQKANFEKVTLFSIADSKKGEIPIPKELKEYTLLSFDENKLKSFHSKVPETMSLTIPGQKSSMSLELVKVEIKTDDYQAIEMPSGRAIHSKTNASHYRGVVKGNPNSIVAISIFNNQVSGLISIGGDDGNMVIGKMDNSKNHIFYKDKDLSHLKEYTCQVQDNAKEYTEKELFTSPVAKAAVKCPKIFFDIDTDIVADKGTQGAVDYIEGVFNQVAVLYANENLTIKMSGTRAWSGSKPFSNNLSSYRTYRNNNSFNGDLGHFVTYNYSGGVAYLSGLCNSYKYGISYQLGNYNNVPVYSASVEVIAHELGHNFGSSHTHACVWNGNNTAIDGCWTPQGNCSRPAIPSNGGTIMSYCHLQNVGISFNNGFGTQPGNVIRNFIASSCVGTCDSGGISCVGVNPWSGSVTYSTGDRVTYQGSLYEWTGSTWKNLGVCPASNDPCAGVPVWSGSVTYSTGDKVTYQGSLYEWTGSTWSNLEACGAQIAAMAPPTELGLIPLSKELDIKVFPNPADDVLNIEISNILNTSSILSIKDVNGRILKVLDLNISPGGKDRHTVDVSMLSPGMYFVQVTDSKRTVTKKVSIK